MNKMIWVRTLKCKKKKKLKCVHSKLDQKVFAIKEININVLEV